MESFETESPLPANRAFVVQVRSGIDLATDLFSGRVEHIASGKAVRFGSVDELLAFISAVLANAALPPGGPSGSTESQGDI